MDNQTAVNVLAGLVILLGGVILSKIWDEILKLREKMHAFGDLLTTIKATLDLKEQIARRRK